jgi:alpha-mannosidase
LYLFWASGAQAHEVYLMNSNHTDYNWNATAAQLDAAMLAELDFYLQQIAATAGNPPEEQARYTPDNWWSLYLYEENRTPAQFAKLIAAIQSGHITIPLNPLVTLYGALPTEAMIRAGYYPGRMERQHGIQFLLAQDIENHTNPWGLASIWAGSGVQYTWKGVCACTPQSPDRVDDELFFWQGPDDKKLLFKWYEIMGNYRDWGGYSEARDNLSSPSQLDTEIARTQRRMPGISSTGLFGAGWDDVIWQSTAVVDAVKAYNDTASSDLAIVSNGVDFFQALEASGETSGLNTLRGGWGNHWDMWPASLAERTARNRRAVEELRTAEALAVWAQRYDPSFWGPVRSSLESGFFSLWKYFEHGWDVAGGGPTLAQMQVDKETWTQDFENAVAGALESAESAVAGSFTTPDEDLVAVFNPLGFERTDFAQIEVAGPGPYVVTDVASGLEVPSQLYSRDGVTYLQFLAESVPSLGYRVYRYEAGTPSSWPDAGTVDIEARRIESALYRVVLGGRGQITEATHKAPEPDVQLAGSNGLSDYGQGTIQSVSAENVGAVSATLRMDLSGPARTVRVTLFAAVDRIEIENAITENETGFQSYRFHVDLPGAQIRFEENGAVARPGLVAAGGDFLPGVKADRMALNHFVDFALSDYHLVVSNWDAYAMRLNDSTLSRFDLTGDEVHVVAMEQFPGAGTANQGGDNFFLNRFALRGLASAYDGAEAMRTSLGHQNPLHGVVLPRNQVGPLTAPTGSLLSVDAANVVVWAFKPAEDVGAGYVVRTWELGGVATNFAIDASGLQAFEAWATSLIETDTGAATVTNGVISAAAAANELTTYRFIGP